MRLKKRKDPVRRFIGDHSNIFCSFTLMPISPFTLPKIPLRPQADGPVEVPAESFSNVQALMDKDSQSTAPAPGDANSKGAEVGIPTESIDLGLFMLHDDKKSLGVIEHGPARTRTISEDIWRASCRNARSSGAW